MSERKSILSLVSHPILRGVLVGVAATQALDALSIAIYDRESFWLRLRENGARGFKHAYERAVDNFARALGRRLTRREMQKWGWRFHKAFGITGGILFEAARRRRPGVGLGAGLAFGAAFFLLVDEILMPLTKLTPGPRAFSWKVHARGAAAHIAYGVAAELTERTLDRVTQPAV